MPTEKRDLPGAVKAKLISAFSCLLMGDEVGCQEELGKLDAEGVRGAYSYVGEFNQRLMTRGVVLDLSGLAESGVLEDSGLRLPFQPPGELMLGEPGETGVVMTGGEQDFGASEG